jgi:hypothetical protein
VSLRATPWLAEHRAPDLAVMHPDDITTSKATPQEMKILRMREA